MFGGGFAGGAAPAPGFGATPAAPSGSGLFGASTPAAPGSSGLFGASTPGGAAPTAPGLTRQSGGQVAAPSSGLFGAAAPAATPGGGLFGSTASTGLFGAPAPAPALGLFGAAPAAAAAAPGGLFGAAAPAPALAAAGGGLFGAPPAAGGGLFGGLGASSTALAPPAGAASSALTLPGATPAAGIASAASSEDAMDAAVFEEWQNQMVKAWDAADYKLCSFKYIFFDDLSQAGTDGMMAPPAVEALHKARAESLMASDAGMWERADTNNPDPSRFCPRQITGFEALHERRHQQLQAARDLAGKLKESQEVIRKLEEQRRVALDLRLRHYAERQQNLSHRVLRLYAAIERQHLLRCHRDAEPPLADSERSYIRRLHEIVSEMQQSAGLSRLYELSTRLQKEASLTTQLEGLPPASRLHLDNLEQWLGRQQEGVRTLIDVSKRDLKDVAIALSEVQGA